MKRIGKRDTGGGSEIDMSPLIDMVFILLIFFVVSTTFVKESVLDIERPGASSASAIPAKALRVEVDRQGRIAIDATEVRPWMLQSRVRDHLAQGAGDTVLVVADRRTQAETLIEVVDQCRLAGAKNVGVITDKEG